MYNVTKPTVASLHQYDILGYVQNFMVSPLIFGCILDCHPGVGLPDQSGYWRDTGGVARWGNSWRLEVGEGGDFSGVQCHTVHPSKHPFSPGELNFEIWRSAVIPGDP